MEDTCHAPRLRIDSEMSSMKASLRPSLFLVGLAAACILCPALRAGDGPAPTYNRDIRPILAENCFACHGPDAGARKAGLRLDQRDAAVKKGAVVPGDPDKSELIHRIFWDEPAKVMPPPRAKKTLTDRQKDLLKRWVAAGAEYQPHWAYLPPVRLEPPAVKDEKWVRNPIDRFLLAPAGTRGAGPFAGSGSGNAHSPRVARPHGPPADARRGRCVRRRQKPRRLREAGGPPAGPGRLRRALGADVARPGALRRLGRLRQRPAADHLAVPRLRDPLVQSKQAVRPVHRRAAGGRPAAQPDRRAAHRHGVPPQHDDQHRRRHQPRGVPQRGDHRPRQHDDDGLDGHVHRLLPVPRPQVRPADQQGVFPAFRDLQQHRRRQPRRRVAVAQRLHRRAEGEAGEAGGRHRGGGGEVPGAAARAGRRAGRVGARGGRRAAGLGRADAGSDGIVGRRDADEAAGRRDPGRRRESREGRLHHHGQDRSQTHHGLSPGGAGRPVAAVEGAGPRGQLRAVGVQGEGGQGRETPSVRQRRFRAAGLPGRRGDRRQGRRRGLGRGAPDRQGPHGHLRAGDPHRERRDRRADLHAGAFVAVRPAHPRQIPPVGHVGEEPARRAEAARRRSRRAGRGRRQTQRSSARPDRRLLRPQRRARTGGRARPARLAEKAARRGRPRHRPDPARAARRPAPPDAHRDPRQLPGARRRGQRRRPRRVPSGQGRHAARPSRPGALAGGPEQPADGARPGQSVLGGDFRRSASCRTSEEFGSQGEPPVASRIARLAGHGAGAAEMGREEVPQAARHVRGLPAVVARHGRAAASATRTTACWPAGRASA